MVERSRGSAVRVAAQNMHEGAAGAFTGEVSAAMLVEADVDAVILGHSERRQLFCETDEALARKVPAALAAGLEPILCVGETEQARDAGQTEAVLERQLRADLAEVDAGDAHPVRYRLRADLGDRHGPHRFTRAGPGGDRLHPRHSAGCSALAADQVRILYGGSVKPANAAELMSQPDVDGALVGGASLDPADFAAIVESSG